MRRGWAVRLAPGDAAAAGALRLLPQAEVCETPDAVWIRGPRLDETIERMLRKLPGASRFEVGPGGECTPAGRLLPAGQLPERKWERLSSWIAPRLGRVSTGAACAAPAPILVVPGGVEAPARVLRTTLEAWGRWASEAPAIRLAPLRFAAGAGQVLVWGHPLPPISGRRYAERDGLAVPCGCVLEPAVDSAILRSVLGLAPGDLAVFDEDGGYEVAAVEALVPATRAAVRRTLARGRRE